ncbi:PEP-CTERM sorting domain-containing protein [Aquabacterium soli]|nr:PEP-CTERM sorting domain-containing protein [Aquabacterium soli]
MQYTLKTLAAAAALTIATAASAQTTTPVGGSLTLNGQAYQLDGGTGTLSFSSSLITALNVGKIAVTKVGDATVTETLTPRPPFGSTRTGVSAAAPITAVTTGATGEVLSVDTTGGALQTANILEGVSLGGTLSVANLSVDLTNKKIFASITGDFRGVATGEAAPYGSEVLTTKDNFHLWNFASISGPTTLNGAGTYANTISGLTITADGFKHFVSALRLVDLGVSTLQGVTDYGTISSTINVSAVPEPSTYAMAIAGLALVGVAARRARKA